MYTLVDILAGPAARRLVSDAARPRVEWEVVPAPMTVRDGGQLEDAALLKQEGVLNKRIEQREGGDEQRGRAEDAGAAHPARPVA